MNKKFLLMAGLTISVLIVLSTSFALASGIQHWKLDSDTQMERVAGPGDDGQSGSVSIPAGGSVIWLADEAALPVGGVTFPDGSWKTLLCLSTNWSANANVLIGKWDPDTNTFTAFATASPGSIIWNGGKNELEVHTQTGSETVPQNDYLALKITNSSGVARSITTAGCSELASPCSDPGYPTPEIAAGVLVGLGVLGLVGYVVFRRRQGVAEGV